jgi:hypothetical protein
MLDAAWDARVEDELVALWKSQAAGYSDAFTVRPLPASCPRRRIEAVKGATI